MQEHNRDVFPTETTKSRFPLIAPLLANDRVTRAFRKYEDRANAAKKRFHKWGRTAIWLISLSSIYGVAEALVIPDAPLSAIFSIIALLVAAVGFGIQIFIIITKTRQEWLISRFAAERLRSIVFMNYACADRATDTADLAARVDAFSLKAVDKLNQELNAGFSCVVEFSPSKALEVLEPAQPPSSPANASLWKQAHEAYVELRVEYQRAFAKSELDRIENDHRVENSAEDAIYFVGAFLVVAALLLRTTALFDEVYVKWVDFIGLAIFIIGLARAIIAGTSLSKQSRTRYAKYVRDLEHAANDAKAAISDLRSSVGRVEAIAHDELETFCHHAMHLTYRV